MSWTQGALLSRIERLVQVDRNQMKDKAKVLNDATTLAIERYGRDRPNYREYVATGVLNQLRYDLPSGYDPDFSEVARVEMPYETDKEKRSTVLGHREWALYDNDFVTKQIDFLNNGPDADTQFRVVYTIPRTLASIPTVHTEAFAALCASFVCDSIGASLANQQQSSFSADTVDHEQGADTWGRRASSFRKQYETVVLPKKDEEIKGFEAVTNVESLLANRTGRMFHRDIC